MNDRGNAVLMCNTLPSCARTVSGESRCMSTMPFAGQAMNDLSPCPSAMPCSVNQYKGLSHRVFLSCKSHGEANIRPGVSRSLGARQLCRSAQDRRAKPKTDSVEAMSHKATSEQSRSWWTMRAEQAVPHRREHQKPGERIR